jgi:hypothetical protein
MPPKRCACFKNRPQKNTMLFSLYHLSPTIFGHYPISTELGKNMPMTYTPSLERYKYMLYNRCGNSGLQLPAVSLGLWHNFGSVDDFENGRAIIRHAFDRNYPFRPGQ